MQAALPLWASDPLFAPAMAIPEVRGQLEEMVIAGHGSLGDGAMFQWPNPRKIAEVFPPAVARLDELTAPSLIMVGELDLLDFQQIADILDDGIADARKVVIPAAGHMANMEQPAIVNAELLAFLQSHPIPEPGGGLIFTLMLIVTVGIRSRRGSLSAGSHGVLD